MREVLEFAQDIIKRFATIREGRFDVAQLGAMIRKKYKSFSSVYPTKLRLSNKPVIIYIAIRALTYERQAVALR